MPRWEVEKLCADRGNDQGELGDLAAQGAQIGDPREVNLLQSVAALARHSARSSAYAAIQKPSGKLSSMVSRREIRLLTLQTLRSTARNQPIAGVQRPKKENEQNQPISRSDASVACVIHSFT